MSLYTPVFPPTPAVPAHSAHYPPLSPSSSGTSATPQPVQPSRTTRLSHLHLAIAALPPTLRPPSPNSAAVDPRIVSQLRKGIRAAVGAAHSDPTSGKWTHVVSLVRLGCTRARYRGVPLAAPPIPISDAGEPQKRQWLLAESDEEWMAWEAARARQRIVPAPLSVADHMSLETKPAGYIEKVHKWQATVASAPASQSPSEIDVPKPKRATSAAKAKRISPLGFPVVKRAATAPKINGKMVAAGPSKAPVTSRFFQAVQDPNIPTVGPVEDVESVALRDPEPVQPISLSPDDAHVPMAVSPTVPKKLPRLDELSDEAFAFFPPSFPSQLVTSTPPLNGGTKRRKIPAIPRPYPSSLLSSPPPFPRTQARLPSSPPANGTKRSASRSPRAGPSTAKKLRLDSSQGTPPPSSSTPVIEAEQFKTTPTPVGLGNAKGVLVPSTPIRDSEESPHKDLRALLASSRRSRTRPRPPSRKPSAIAAPAPAIVRDKGKGKAVYVDRPHTPESSPAKPHYFSSPASGSQSDAETPMRVRAAPALPPFPPDFSRDQALFAPQGVSTQPAAAASQGMGMWDSQFDLEGNVDRVSAILDRDVDFGAWLRDTPVEADEEREGPAGTLEHAGAIEL